MFHKISHPVGLSVKYPKCHRRILTLGSGEKQVERVECGGKQEHTERKKENEVHIGFRDRASLRSLLSLCLLACFLSLSGILSWMCVCLSVYVCLWLCFAQWCLLLRLNLPLEVLIMKDVNVQNSTEWTWTVQVIKCTNTYCTHTEVRL